MPSLQESQEEELAMLLCTQINIGMNSVADGAHLLDDAAQSGGFVSEASYGAISLAATVKKLRDAADKLDRLRAQLVANAEPANQVVHLQAAE
jgi:hypothetical protein